LSLLFIKAVYNELACTFYRSRATEKIKQRKEVNPNLRCNTRERIYQELNPERMKGWSACERMGCIGDVHLPKETLAPIEPLLHVKQAGTNPNRGLAFGK